MTNASTTRRIAPQSGAGFEMKRGQILRIVDPEGEQVSDLFAFAAGDARCYLSSGRSLDYAGKLYLTIGDLLYANDSRVLFTILDDTVGRHDFTLTPCSQRMFEILYQHQGHHPSCHENLCLALEPFGIEPHQIHTSFNVFMNVWFDAAGTMTVDVPRSKAGDYIELRAEVDLWCALTACSAEGSNNGTFKPIDFTVRDG
ncbi:MAG: urea carboxylase-associated family protein [Proteobacteria bacterium]|nr:MAG: urea carboxylase-associated family protein [Pseudomonadota bacterium]